MSAVVLRVFHQWMLLVPVLPALIRIVENSNFSRVCVCVYLLIIPDRILQPVTCTAL